MKHVFLLVVLCLSLAGSVSAQHPSVSITELQEMPLDSLLLADTLQNSNPSLWWLQRPSTYYLDTVQITGVCVVQPKVLTYTAAGFTMLIYDTGTVNNWGALFVRVNSPTDSAQAILDGFLNVERGDVVTMTGIVSEFPTNSMNSSGQFQPLPGFPVQIVGTAPIPTHVHKNVGDFYTGLFSGGLVRYSTGEPFEGMLVQLTNLTVDARVNTTRGTFSAVDSAGNQITTYDGSRFFTLGHGGTSPFPADSLWILKYPPVGARIDTLRGFITTVSGGENPRGYRISPVYRGDVVVGVVLPSLTTHRRYPILVTPDSAARITARAQKQTGGYGVQSVKLWHSINNGPFTALTMTYNPVDSAHEATIPAQPAGTFVRYFIKAQDSSANVVTLASSAFGGAASDTSKGTFFYTVLNGPTTIRDIQYTPFVNGRTPYLGAFTSVSGIVTADTAHLLQLPASTGGTNTWYLQSGTDPWSGIWVTGIDTTLLAMQNGDSVTVTGQVEENFDVTRIGGIVTPVVVHSSGNPVPAPALLTTGRFGPVVGNGNPNAEPYEGMLVRFRNVVVTSIDPVFGNPYEFEVNDGTGPMLVRRDGTHSYSNNPLDSAFGKTILRVGTEIGELTGVLYYSFNRYKVVPRTNADIVLPAVSVNPGWNMVSNPVTTAADSVLRLFPSSILPYGFAFNGASGYVQESRMANGRGYWAKFADTAWVPFTGALRFSDTIEVQQGWNLVGSISQSVDTALITSTPPGIKASPWYGFAAGYNPSPSLRPGRAYWVKTNAAGSFQLTTGAEPFFRNAAGSGDVRSLNSLTIRDAQGMEQTLWFGQDGWTTVRSADFEMPPAPPEGVLDARFESAAGGTQVSIFPAEGEGSAGLTISTAAAPVTLSWNIVSPGARYLLTDGQGAGSPAQELAGQGSMVLGFGGTRRLVLSTAPGEAVPKEFSLEQNYPNPFNPTTALRYTVPVAGPVTLRVYNLLGQEVRTLVDEIQPPGVRTVEWNALNNAGQPVGSGVYFYKLEGTGFSMTRKMMLLR